MLVMCNSASVEANQADDQASEVSLQQNRP